MGPHDDLVQGAIKEWPGCPGEDGVVGTVEHEDVRARGVVEDRA